MASEAETLEPLQQGELDLLCSVYAAVNLRRLRNPEEDSFGVFKELIESIHMYGNLARASLEGIDPRDICWLLNKAGLGEYNIIKEPSTDTLAEIINTTSKGIFISLKPEDKTFGRVNGKTRAEHINDGDDPFTHYTIVTKVDAESLTLFDSYGFSKLMRNGNEIYLENAPVNITHAFQPQ